MNHITQLVNQLCPDGVVYKRLGEIAQRNKGVNITAGKMKNLNKEGAPVKVFAGGQTVAYMDYEDLPNANIIKEPSIIVKSRGNIGFEYYVKPFTHKNEMWSYTIKDENVNDKFVYYYLLNKVSYFQRLAKANSVKLAQLVISDTDDFEIPVPPLQIQEEIVRVLDNFSALEAELEAELEARQRQYAHYRDALLQFDCSVTTKKLGDLGVFYGGLSGKSKADFTDGNAKFITYKNIYSNPALNLDDDATVKIGEHERQNVIEYGDVLFTGSSETPDECGFSSVVTKKPTEKMYLNSFCFGYRLYDKTIFVPDFLKHLLRSNNLRKQIFKTASGVTRYNVSKKLFAEVVIPIPPIAEQQRIVDILDKFAALTTDLQRGLPAELAARRKQYAHYRDTLLTFKKREND